MPTIFTKLTNEQAPKELKKFAIISIVFSVVSIFILPILGALGTGAGIRALYISAHIANKGKKETTLYRILSVLAILIGIFDLAVYLTSRG